MRSISADEVKTRVHDLEQVSTVPESLARIMAITQDPGSTAMDLANEISKDPALTLKVLRTVNSSFYGFERRIQTVSDAVILLGFTEVERLALTISLINLFGGSRYKARALNQLWRHSLVASMAADILVEVYAPKAPDAAGVHASALLHDVGKAVIWQCFPDILPQILRVMKEEGRTAQEVERELLDGVDHCEVGAWVADSWNLPHSVVESIRYHHAPDECDATHVLVHVTHLANAACYQVGCPSMQEQKGAAPAHDVSCQVLQTDNLFAQRVDERVQSRRDVFGAIASSLA